MSGYLSHIKVDHHEIHDGEVQVVFTNGDRLPAEEARELATRISEELTMADFIKDFTNHQQPPGGRYH